MRAEQVLSRSNLEVKVNYVSKCQQNPTIKTRHNFQISVSKPPIPGPVPGPLVCAPKLELRFLHRQKPSRRDKPHSRTARRVPSSNG